MIRKECKYCDTGFHPIKTSEGELVCASCGAEWNPIEVDYDEEELRKENEELDRWFAQYRDDSED